MAVSDLEPNSTRTSSGIDTAESFPADVGVILGADESLDRALILASQIAASRGGRLCLMRYIDNASAHETHDLAVQSAAARAQLADLRAGCRSRDPHLVVTDRLHVGSLQSMLERLEPSIGSLVLASAGSSETRDVLAACALPVTIVSPAEAPAHG